jgi:hypothetical protein
MDPDADYHERSGHHPTVAAAWLQAGTAARTSVVAAASISS